MSSVLQTKVSNAIAALERNMAVLDSTQRGEIRRDFTRLGGSILGEIAVTKSELQTAIDDLDDHSNGAFAAFKAAITPAVRAKLSDSTINLLIASVAMKRFEEGV